MDQGRIKGGKIPVGLRDGRAHISPKNVDLREIAADVWPFIGLSGGVLPKKLLLFLQPCARADADDNPKIIGKGLVKHPVTGSQRVPAGRGRGRIRIPDCAKVALQAETMGEADLLQDVHVLKDPVDAANAPHHHRHPKGRLPRHQPNGEVFAVPIGLRPVGEGAGDGDGVGVWPQSGVKGIFQCLRRTLSQFAK